VKEEEEDGGRNSIFVSNVVEFRGWMMENCSGWNMISIRNPRGKKYTVL